MRRVELDLPDVDERDEDGDRDPEPVPEAPGPRPPAVDDVFLAQPRLLGAEQARPRDESADDQVDEAAEADDSANGRGDGPADGEMVAVAVEEVRSGARKDCDRGGDARQPTKLGRERDRLLAGAEKPGYVRSCHGSASVDAILTAFVTPD